MKDVLGSALFGQLIRTNNIPKPILENKIIGPQIRNYPSFNASMVLKNLEELYNANKNPQFSIKNGKILSTKPDTFEELVDFLIHHYINYGNSIDKFANRCCGNTQRFYDTLIRQYSIFSRLNRDIKRLDVITLGRIAQARPDKLMIFQSTRDRIKHPCHVQNISPTLTINNYGKLCPNREMLYIAYVVQLYFDEQLNKNRNPPAIRFKRIQNNVHKDYISDQYSLLERIDIHRRAGMFSRKNENVFAREVYWSVWYAIHYLKSNDIKNPMDHMPKMSDFDLHEDNVDFPTWESVQIQDNIDEFNAKLMKNSLHLESFETK